MLAAGRSDCGQLGLALEEDPALEMAVPHFAPVETLDNLAGRHVQVIKAGSTHSFALLNGGHLYGWVRTSKSWDLEIVRLMRSM